MAVKKRRRRCFIVEVLGKVRIHQIYTFSRVFGLAYSQP